jgi:transposase-like protein
MCHYTLQKILEGSIMMQCPNCHAEDTVKNGGMHHGKPKFLWKNCGRQWVAPPEQKTLSPETKALMDKLLLGKIPLAGMARVTGRSERWWPQYGNPLPILCVDMSL